MDLVSNIFFVMAIGALLLLIDISISFLGSFLFYNNSLELLSFNISSSGKVFFLFMELFISSLIKLSQ
jgi:hypothetical protein